MLGIRHLAMSPYTVYADSIAINLFPIADAYIVH